MPVMELSINSVVPIVPGFITAETPVSPVPSPTNVPLIVVPVIVPVV